MYDYKTPEYERYVRICNANFASGGKMNDEEAEALAAAQRAAALAYEQGAWIAYSA